MRYFHFVARLKLQLKPFIEREHFVDLWSRLQNTVSKTVGCVLMPEHLHLLAETSNPERIRRALASELSGFTRKYFRGQNLWEPVPDPKVIPDFHHLKRQARYVHLNPCRRELTNDPLIWEWCTHREAVEAAASDWFDKKPLLEAFRINPSSFKEVFHRYVSSDPSVKVAGTSLPGTVAPEKLIATHETLVKAVLQANRGPAGTSTARRQVIRLGRQMGVERNESLALAAGISARSVRHILSQPPQPEDAAVIRAAVRLLSASGRYGI